SRRLITPSPRHEAVLYAARHYQSSFFFVLLAFFFTATTPTEIYTLSLHDALPISGEAARGAPVDLIRHARDRLGAVLAVLSLPIDRKSTRLNSSHVKISYAVFCLKKKTRSVESLWRVYRLHDARQQARCVTGTRPP